MSENPNPEGGEHDLRPASQEVLASFLEECKRLADICSESPKKYPGNKHVSINSVDEGQEISLLLDLYNHSQPIQEYERSNGIIMTISVVSTPIEHEDVFETERFIFVSSEDEPETIVVTKEQKADSSSHLREALKKVMSGDPQLIEEAMANWREEQLELASAKEFTRHVGLDLVTGLDIQRLQTLISTGEFEPDTGVDI